MNERLNIVHVQTSDLRPSEYNPRKWSAEAEEQLAESVRKFGIVDPGYSLIRHQVVRISSSVDTSDLPSSKNSKSWRCQ